jgi:hypothetical protein
MVKDQQIVFSQVGILLQSIKRKIFIKIYNFSFFFKCEEFLENRKMQKKKLSQKLEILINLS